VHRLLNPFGFAAGQLAVFQGASEAPIPPHFRLLLVWLFRSRRKNGAGRAERATQQNSQPAAAQRVAGHGPNRLAWLFAAFAVACIWASCPCDGQIQVEAYVPNSSNRVSVIDTKTNTVVGLPIPVGSQASGVAVTPDGRFAYVANFGGNTVLMINTTTNSVVGAAIPVGGQPSGVAVTPDGRFAYVVNQASNTVSIISTATNTVVGSIPVGFQPNPVAITPDGRFVYVGNHLSNTVSVISTTTNTVVGSIPVGSLPVGVAVTPDSRFAYVTNLLSSTVSVINTATNSVVGAAIPVGPVPFAFGSFVPIILGQDFGNSFA